VHGETLTRDIPPGDYELVIDVARAILGFFNSPINFSFSYYIIL